jgi:hypothetical protein
MDLELIEYERGLTVAFRIAVLGRRPWSVPPKTVSCFSVPTM